LIDTLRILPPSPSSNNEQSQGPVLGIEEGGLQSAKALLLARYFMYSQVYFHSVRRIYDIHLKDFLVNWLEKGMFSIDVKYLLRITDNEVTSALRYAVIDSTSRGHDYAIRIINRKHFKVLCQRNPDDIRINPEAAFYIYENARNLFGKENIRYDSYTQKGGTPDFPVLTKDNRIVSSLSLSHTLKNLPTISVNYVFVKPDHYSEASSWLSQNRRSIIDPEREVER